MGRKFPVLAGAGGYKKGREPSIVHFRLINGKLPQRQGIRKRKGKMSLGKHKRESFIS